MDTPNATVSPATEAEAAAAEGVAEATEEAMDAGWRVEATRGRDKSRPDHKKKLRRRKRS